MTQPQPPSTVPDDSSAFPARAPDGPNGPVADPSVEVVDGRPAPEDAAEVELLAARAADADGVAPLSEQTLLDLRHGDDAVRHLLLRSGPDGPLVGYLHLDLAGKHGRDVDESGPDAEPATAELVIAPDLRRRGMGRLLVRQAQRQAGDRGVQFWAHGAHPGTAALATALGFSPVRELRRLRRPLDEGSPALPEPAVPDDVTIRTFRPGVDDDAWLAVNAAAFADHPEQGTWTREDLHARLREPWFDPEGFFVAERRDSGRVVGFHWTKVHPAGAVAPDAVGEVYVVGVHPDQHGTGLGRALTLVGLAHLRDQGLSTVMLYVDADNTAAVGLYESLGFTRWDVDVVYAKPD